MYNSVFNITEENIKFVLYTERLDSEFSYTGLKDKVAEVLVLSDVSSEDLAHEKLGPDIIQFHRKLSTEKSQTDGYFILLKSYLQTTFRDFETYPRISTGLNEHDVQLILRQYNSKFETFKSSPGAYTFKDLAEVLSRGFRTVFKIAELRPDRIHFKSGSILINSHNVRSITKLTLRPDVNALRFDERSFLVQSWVFNHIGIIKILHHMIVNTIVEKMEI